MRMRATSRARFTGKSKRAMCTTRSSGIVAETITPAPAGCPILTTMRLPHDHIANFTTALAGVNTPELQLLTHRRKHLRSVQNALQKSRTEASMGTGTP